MVGRPSARQGRGHDFSPSRRPRAARMIAARRRPGVPGRGHRADGYPVAGPHRHGDARDAVLVERRDGGVRRRRALRRVDGADLGAGHVPAEQRGTEVGDAVTSLSIRGVTKSYGDTQVLDGVDLEVPAQSVTAILGPSGCGKTTLLRIIARFTDPDHGTLAFG